MISEIEKYIATFIPFHIAVLPVEETFTKCKQTIDEGYCWIIFRLDHYYDVILVNLVLA